MRNNNTDFFVGMDLGEKKHNLCVLDARGAVVSRDVIANREGAIVDYFRRFSTPAGVTVAMETGTHSPWISHLLQEAGFTVFVGNARKIRVIWSTDNKNDERDAEVLARIVRFDPKLLSPITHRSLDAHLDLALIKARDALVRSRSNLVNFVRGTLKAVGVSVPSCSTGAFPSTVLALQIPEALKEAIYPVLETVEALTVKIRRFDRRIQELCREKYPETARLQQVAGVGPVTSLAFVLTLEHADRFRKSREIGPYLGLTPRRDQSGESDKPRSITKAGNEYLRRLLVGAANYILGPFGPDCDLRRYGLRICARGGKIARRKAKVAVARKLAVLLHHLWKSGEVYRPFQKNAERNPAA